MDIYFKTQKLQKVCSIKKETVKKYGPKMARKIHQRLMELRAATCLEDISKVPPPRCHLLSGDRKGQLSVDLVHPFRLLFIPADDSIPLSEAGGLDWAMVSEIEIIGIVDTH